MISKKEFACLECDVCGRIYLWKHADPKEVLAHARESGWECPPANQVDRDGDVCPRCRPPQDNAQVLPALQPRAAIPAAPPKDVDMRSVISGVLAEEVSPGLSAAEEIARVLVQGALAGDKGMIRILTDLSTLSDLLTLFNRRGARRAPSVVPGTPNGLPANQPEVYSGGDTHET